MPLVGSPQQGSQEVLLGGGVLLRLEIVARGTRQVGVGVEAPLAFVGEHHGRVGPALARLEQRDEVVRDRRAALARRHAVERPTESALDRVARRRLEGREPDGHRVALGERADEATRIAGRVDVGAEIGVRGEVREAGHRLLELGGAGLRLAARDHAEAELVAHVGRPGLERERTANRLVTVAARAERFGERRVCVAVGGRAVERLVDEGERPGACPVSLGCERQVRRS